MAARKSCTHLTWAEAKAKVGGGTSSSTGKKKAPPKAMAHSEVLAQKLVAKHSAGDEGLTRAQQRRMERADAKASAVIQQAKEERRRELGNQFIQPHEQSRRRMYQLVEQLRSKPITASTADVVAAHEDLMKIVESKQMQLQEIMALEAIFADEYEFQMADASRKEELQRLVDDCQVDESNESLLVAIAEHPPLVFTIAQTIEDNNNQAHDNMELVASVLVRVILPPLYPLHDQIPESELADVMVTSKTADPIRPDKTLESLVHLDEKNLKSQMAQACSEILPDLCVYEVCGTWLSEHLFDFVELRTHALIE